MGSIQTFQSAMTPRFSITAALMVCALIFGCVNAQDLDRARLKKINEVSRSLRQTNPLASNRVYRMDELVVQAKIQEPSLLYIIQLPALDIPYPWEQIKISSGVYQPIEENLLH